VEDQLVRVCKDAASCTDGIAVARFAYDAFGRRVQKVAGGVSAVYAYDGSEILKETRSDHTSYLYIHGPRFDEPLGREDQAGNRVYYHADGLGSITKITDASGAVVHSYQYDPWGNIESDTGSLNVDGVKYAFTGREWDHETGLYYYRARYYDPELGRFISEDPIGLAGGSNAYRYAGDRPSSSTDPLGLDERNVLAEVGEKLAKWNLEQEGYTVVLVPGRKAVNQGGFDMIATKGDETLTIDNKAFLSREVVSSASSLTTNLQKNVVSAIEKLTARLGEEGVSDAEAAAIRVAIRALESGAFQRVITGCGGIASKVGPKLARAGVVFRVLGKAGVLITIAVEAYNAEPVGGFLADVPLTDEELKAYHKIVGQ
jgi:RHS repeat-associated protein